MHYLKAILVKLNLLIMNEYRYMRSILFFDLPVENNKQKRDYNEFIKILKVNGFFRIQKSVFCKMSIDVQTAEASIKAIRTKLPSEGIVMVLSITEKQFSNIQYLLGGYETDIIETEDRVVEL